MKYRFQDHLELTVETNGRSSFDSYFRNEYERIDATSRIDGEPRCRIRLEIVGEIPTDLPASAVVRKVRFKKLFTFEYAIVGHGTTDAIVYFKDHPVRRVYVTAVGVFVQAQVLEPVMYLSLLNQGIFLMHSAGVSKDGRAKVFPAYGGTGKTTTCMSLLGRGYDFLGDDLLLVDPTAKTVFAYPRPLHLFTYNVRNLQGAKVPALTAFAIYFKNVLRFFLERILRTEFLISTRIHADEVLPDLRISEPVDLDQIVFLKKDGDHETIDLTSDDAIQEHARNIVDSADLNVSLFEILDNAEQAEEIRATEVQVAATMLRNANSFAYLNTRKVDLEQIPDHIEQLAAAAIDPGATS